MTQRLRFRCQHCNRRLADVSCAGFPQPGVRTLVAPPDQREAIAVQVVPLGHTRLEVFPPAVPASPAEAGWLLGANTCRLECVCTSASGERRNYPVTAEKLRQLWDANDNTPGPPAVTLYLG